MTQYFFKGAAKRLSLSLVLLSALGGCAVYAPPLSGPYGYYGTDANGQAMHAAPPAYAGPYYAPAYIAPPVSLNLGLGFWNGAGWYGGSGYGGHRWGGGGRGWGSNGWRHGGGHR